MLKNDKNIYIHIDTYDDSDKRSSLAALTNKADIELMLQIEIKICICKWG